MAFAILALMLASPVQVSANDGGIPSHYQEQSAVASIGTSTAQVMLITPFFQVGATETIKPVYGNCAYSKASLGKLLIGVVGGYKDRPGWQYRSPM